MRSIVPNLRGKIVVAFLLGFVWASKTWAGPSLVVLEDNGDPNPIYRQVIEGLGAVITGNNLGTVYDHIDVLKGAQADRGDFFNDIRKRGAEGVDVVVLTHGMPKTIELTEGNITEAQIRANKKFAGLRMVYMMGCYSASLLDAWRSVGAQAVLGHQDINSLPGFFFPHLMKLWGEGKSLHEAAVEAYQFSENSALLMNAYIKETDLLNSVGVGRSEPVMEGVDIDHFGHTYPSQSLAFSPVSKAPSTTSRSVYAHSSFENGAIQLLSAMIPQATLDSSAIPDVQTLVDQLKGPAWDQLHDSFPSAAQNLPDFLPGPDPGDQIWIDGDTLRYLLSSVQNWGGQHMTDVLNRLNGIQLVRGDTALSVSMYFTESFTLQLQDPNQVANWKLYAVDVPQTLRLSIVMNNGLLTVTGLDQGSSGLTLKIKFPSILPDTVYLREIQADLTTGDVQVNAGVIGDVITVVAKAQVLTKSFDGVDIWESIAKNIEFWVWPDLEFATL